MPERFKYPKIGVARGPGFWANPINWVAARKKFRRDHTVDWRQRFESAAPPPPSHSATFDDLLTAPGQNGFSFLLLGDTGEGDHSQYSLLPLVRALAPDFIVINGDVAYPAGRESDFEEGFFRPYENLGVPIWAVPGNHEYYSTYNGQEFFDVFCTSRHVALWQQRGLRFVQQPGTYWELSADWCPLTVLAVDSGMSASMDASQSLFGLLKSDGDPAQIAWLDQRLAVAKAAGKRVLLMFHIPSLVNLEQAKEPKLESLHSVIGKYGDIISAVVTAHEHNFQHYSPAQFARFVGRGMQPKPNYFVSGSGGAFLSAVKFDLPGTPEQFSAARVFPNREQWNQVSNPAQKVASIGSAAQSILARVTDAFADHDKSAFQSLLRIVVEPNGAGMSAQMIPYFQESLEQLYADQKGIDVIVQAGQPPPTQKSIDSLTRSDPADPPSGVVFPLA